MNSRNCRKQLVETLHLDLVGPSNDHSFAHELLPQSPQRWYLTGYLVPENAPEEDRRSEDESDDLDQPFVPDASTMEAPSQQPPDQLLPGGGSDDNEAPEQQVQVNYRPSSLGLSVLAKPGTKEIAATIRWGDYLWETQDGEDEIDEAEVDRRFEEEMARERAEKEVETASRLREDAPEYKAKRKYAQRGYRREPREEVVKIPLAVEDGTEEIEIPNSRGLKLVASWRPLPYLSNSNLPAGTKTVSVFVVNDRPVKGERMSYKDIAFQIAIELTCEESFLGRPDLRGAMFPEETDADERIADLHYRDVLEFAVGHGVAATADENDDGTCRSVHTLWVPDAEIPRVDHADIGKIGEVELSMERLGFLEDASEADHLLSQLVTSYRAWISRQDAELHTQSLTAGQKETAEELIIGAKVAAERIERGIQSLADPVCLEAFRIANRAMARSARQRFAHQQGKKPHEVDAPRWRAFQLAFILMNLEGLFDPRHNDRKIVDLLFFPTGGGKTEAYLGLAAFTLVVRRRQNPGISSAGVSIIMRYTLRLLTLDQLGRAAALMCALELERAGKNSLGEWPFEIGLWVGSAATPNRMGKAGDTGPGHRDTAYAKLTRFLNNPGKHPAPIPLEECPWCGTQFVPESFTLEPDGQNPRDLRVCCDNMHCEFSAAQNSQLPVLGVDEPIYRRLPCFLIATVDKFAALPWTGLVGALFGRVERYDAHGFYGPCHPGVGKPLPDQHLLPPDLIIQDELHLISGPLGTVAGIYEAAIEALCQRDLGDDDVLLPKIIASTATVRRADRQIRALFARPQTSIFPAPGPDRHDSFFAQTIPVSDSDPGRLYLGIAAQGRSMKVVLLRTALALLSGAQTIYEEAGGQVADNPCDPYMTLLGYFNSLRELGGSRRIVEDEVFLQCQMRWKRKRHDPQDDLFRRRFIKRNPVELTSRVGTNDVAKARRELAADFSKPERVDVALATNMISVGLDIGRLGLMMVLGQPKTSSEYIQATSRVGRERAKPGLVVALLNAHKPRDRSHYERFGIYHRTFYRAVEATSVTPFAPRALDRALSAALVGLCRHSLAEMEPASQAGKVQSHLPALQQIVRTFAKRALSHDAYLDHAKATALEAHVDALTQELLAKWSTIAAQCANQGSSLHYQKFEGARGGESLIRDFLDPELDTKASIFRSFRANRSMRDVEPAVDILPTKSSIGTNQ